MNDDEAKKLRAPFPAAAIGKLPKGGVMLDYVGHAAVTDRLLQVDPGWTWEPLAVDEFGLPAMDAAGNLWIKLTICGVTRLGVGDGPTQKIRIGDAIRNAAMRFGVALDLWAKEDLHDSQQSNGTPAPAAPTRQKPPVVRVDPGEQVSPAQLKKIGASMSERGMADRGAALAYVRRVVGRDDIESRNDLTKREASVLIDALERLAPPPPPEDPGGDPWPEEST